LSQVQSTAGVIEKEEVAMSYDFVDIYQNKLEVRSRKQNKNKTRPMEGFTLLSICKSKALTLKDNANFMWADLPLFLPKVRKGESSVDVALNSVITTSKETLFAQWDFLKAIFFF
jgi:hypothetical protein